MACSLQLFLSQPPRLHEAINVMTVFHFRWRVTVSLALGDPHRSRTV
jgi:hypothetical protein